MIRNRFKIILFTVLSLFILVSCTKKDTLTISTKQESFIVTLSANPTTGFLWSIIDYDKNIFELINQQYIASKVGLIGAGGNASFTFKIKKQSKYPSSSIIKFKYSRSWEPNSAISKEIKVLIKS